MSIEHNANVVIGFLVDVDDFLAPLFKELPKVIHREKRFNPKTGERVDDELVTHFEGGGHWVFGDVRVDVRDNPEDILEAIGHATGAYITLHGDLYAGRPDRVAIELFGLVRRPDEGYNFKDVWAARKKFAKIEKKLRELGLDPGAMGIFSVLDTY